MDVSNIVLIIGVSALFLERILACALKIKKSRCWGGEVEMRTPEKNPSSLKESNALEQAVKDGITDEIEAIVKKLNEKK